MLRDVLDTNVIVSSVISKKGAPSQLIHAWHDSCFALITSEIIIKEVQKVLSKPRLKDPFNITDEQTVRLVVTLRKDAILVPGKSDVHGAIPQDPSDEIFLSTALDSKADFIVSGDKHLLNLMKFKNIPIVTLRDFLKILERENPV